MTTLPLRIEYDEAVWSRLASTVPHMREAAWGVPASRAGLDRAKLGWALDWADTDTEAEVVPQKVPSEGS